VPSLAVVPASGKGTRFGGVKLLARVNDEPILEHVVRCLLDGGLTTVVVVLPPVPPSTFAAVRLLTDPRVRVATNPDPSRGMFSSIQAGLRALDGDPILVLPGDMPFVQPETVRAVLEACERTGRIVSPRYFGQRGHPVALPGRFGREILGADAHTTLSVLLRGRDDERLDVDVPDRGILRDVDVAGDLSSS
jgi:molybdenum cofactor cytidylyltransferase